MQTWKKQWLKFVGATTINAGIYISYRLYIHYQNKKKPKNKTSELKIVKNTVKGSLEEQLIEIKNQKNKSSKPKLQLHKNKDKS